MESATLIVWAINHLISYDPVSYDLRPPFGECKVKPGSRLAHSCRSLSQFLWHEAARSISIPPDWDASPSQVTAPQFVRFPQQFAGTQLYSWAERGTVRVVSCPRTQHCVSGNVRARPQLVRYGDERTNHEVRHCFLYKITPLI